MATARPGLRERKKARTRAAIQEHALRLFQAQGYAETTIEQIADAADVSQSTFFRYFPAKEDVVLHDELDPRLIESLLAQPPELDPITAVRAAMRDVYSELTPEQLAGETERQRLAREVPELRARALDQYVSGLGLLTEAFAKRLGRPADSVAIRTLAGAVIGAGLAAILADDTDRIDDYFAQLAEGLKG
jgi:AcrR family transcriptional regulator